MGGGVSKHNIVVIGLDGSGKSTVVEALSPNSNKTKTTIVPPTYDGIRYAEAHWSEQMWDLSGQQKFRDMWPAYLAACSAVVLVVDCADVDRLAVVQEAARTAHSSAPAHAPILVLANKRSQVHIAQDARSSPATAAPAPRLLSKEEVERVALASSIAAAGRSVRVVLANALSGDGMEAAAAWLEERLAHQQGAD